MMKFKHIMSILFLILDMLVCNTTLQHVCANEMAKMLLFPNIFNLTQTNEKLCPKSCSMLYYSSQVDHQQDYTDLDPKGAKIEYMFCPPGNIH